MTHSFTPRAGAVFSADIAVPEHEHELAFYSRMLGTGETPLWREDLMNNLGIPIIGLGARTPAYDALPLQWMPHIQVADVGASIARATELGATILMQSGSGEAASGWAVILDPNGAAFGIVPVASEVPPAPTQGSASPEDAAAAPVGRIAWLDLTVSDAPTTRDFYRDVVGWTVQELAMKDDGDEYADYVMVDASGTAAAGICHARGGNKGLPPVWLIYLPVGDVAESLRRAESEGGAVLKSVKGKDGDVVYAAVRDPVGACLALMPG